MIPYRIEYQSVLIQERVFNVGRVFIMVQNRMEERRKIINYIYFILSTIFILRDRLHSAAEKLKKVLLKNFQF